MSIIEIKTSIFDDETIQQECLYKERGNDTVITLLKTKEKSIREALIKLGWTPPEEKTNGNA